MTNSTNFTDYSASNCTSSSTCSFCDIGSAFIVAFIVALAAFGVLIAF